MATGGATVAGEATRPYARAAKAGASWWYAGCLVTSLAEGAETAGQVSAVEAVIRKGMEPPPHTHTREDEAFFILDGTWTFRVGEGTVEATPGTWVWLPRGVTHTFAVDADGARALIFSFPGGHLEAMFRPFSEPAAELALPPVPADLPLAAMMELDHELGVVYPDDAGS
jgi:quercetin dioxygenase-like cupin family protein